MEEVALNLGFKDEVEFLHAGIGMRIIQGILNRRPTCRKSGRGKTGDR
jgi:hypothetical protein